jgi:hypothetical protein
MTAPLTAEEEAYWRVDAANYSEFAYSEVERIFATLDAARATDAEPCSIEPALSQHEYAVDYCDTHDRPADDRCLVRYAARATVGVERPDRIEYCRVCGKTLFVEWLHTEKQHAAALEKDR